MPDASSRRPRREALPKRNCGRPTNRERVYWTAANSSSMIALNLAAGCAPLTRRPLITNEGVPVIPRLAASAFWVKGKDRLSGVDKDLWWQHVAANNEENVDVFPVIKAGDRAEVAGDQFVG